MSVRHLNYTGRQRITREHVRVTVIDDDGPAARIDASLDLSSYGFPGTAEVILEAQAGWTVQRFVLGTVAHWAVPTDARLSEFDSLAGLLFRLKVIGTGDPARGRILGEADKLRPTGMVQEPSQRSFIVVRPVDLGQLPWRVAFDESQPLLLVNRRIEDFHGFLRRREYAALILPEVLRTVLREALESGNDQDDPRSWQAQAIRFGERAADTDAPDPNDDDAMDQWVESAVDAFCRRHRLLDGLLEGLERDQG